MAKTSYPLASVYGLLEPGPVVLLTTLRNEQTNVMPQRWPRAVGQKFGFLK